MRRFMSFGALAALVLMSWFVMPADSQIVLSPAPGGGTTLTDSASLRTALSDETGTGAAVFGGGNIGAATATSLTSAAGADGCFGWFCRASLTLTDAQIKALPTTPVQIVAAPGAGKMTVPSQIVGRLDSTAGAYVETVNVWLQHTPGWGVISDQLLFFSAAEANTSAANAYSGRLSTDAVNQPLFLFNSAGSDYTGGDVANTMKVIVYYTINTVP